MTPRTVAPLAAAALALSGCSDDGGTRAAPSASPSASSSASPSASPSPSPSRDPRADPTPSAADVSASPAGQAALAFVRAVAAGDHETAFALLTPSSQDAVGGREGFVALRSALAEGFGAFASVDPRVVRTTVDEGTGVLTLAADVTREGSTGFGTATMPYREQAGRVALDLFDRAEGTVEFVSPARGGTVPAGGEAVVAVPEGVEPVVSIEGQRLFFAREPGEPQLRASVPQGLEPGSRHVLTVAWADPGGRLGADAIGFTIA